MVDHVTIKSFVTNAAEIIPVKIQNDEQIKHKHKCVSVNKKELFS